MARDKRKWYQKLHNKYRLVMFDDESFEEKISFRLSRMNVFVVAVSLSFFLVFITTYIIAFTPLREYIPGYTDLETKRSVYSLQRRADSLELVVEQNQLFFDKIRRIVMGYEDGDDSLMAVQQSFRNKPAAKTDTIRLTRSREDSMLRLEFESMERFNLLAEGSIIPESRRRAMGIANFFVPLRGTVTSKFNPSQRHFGVDIVSRPNEAIKATLEGVVVFADWTPEKGYIIGIQHAGNFFSVYKHNSVLLRREGDVVRAGEPIAIIGQGGELSTGPHLHFELWYNASPINPEDYITF
jgi:murein DD-endopeptidase MepM/ murein hydrolase activator NlpD